MAGTYSYTHGGSTVNDHMRLLIGDNRGAVGAFTGTNQMFSDEELAVFFDTAFPSRARLQAAVFALSTRLCREAMAAGVAGTTDTSERPQALLVALENLRQMDSTTTQDLHTDLQKRANADLGTSEDDLEDPLA